MKIFILFACLFLALAFAQDQQCPANKEYNKCGSACPPKCNQQGPQACTLQCVVGCFCKTGLVLDDQGNCVDPTNCPNQCPKPHQKWYNCGTACEPSCKEPNPQVCTKNCVIGCQCEAGYVKDDRGNCILEKDCPKNQTCGPKEVWSDNGCGVPCQDRQCPNNPPKLCPELCMLGGSCVCKPNFCRNRNETCVPLPIDK